VTDALSEIGRQAREAARDMARASTVAKNAALEAAARAIAARTGAILAINAGECVRAAASGTTPAFLDRMTLTAPRIGAIVAGLKEIASQPDPVGAVIRSTTRPNGMRIERVRVPIGVIAVIYESRPNVTIDAAAIALKAGNAVILRGGSECLSTSAALFDAFISGCAEAGLPAKAAQLVRTADRAAVGALLGGLEGAIDLVIPRGGRSLVARVEAEARVATLGHLDGLCHVYIDASANPKKAVDITLNSKMRRTGVCGAAETLLIDKAVVAELYPPVAAALRAAGCALRGDAALRALDPTLAAADEDDWRTEYLAPILSIAAVDGVEGAVRHIRRYGTGHTEAIVAEDQAAARAFLDGVDSAIVLHNASTQFADGGEFGFGGEIGIATGRLHARGPVGVEELTTYKNIVYGSGQIRP
jgi:glutamate-5-semialdehyde dehydrogenase